VHAPTLVRLCAREGRRVPWETGRGDRLRPAAGALDRGPVL